jgi:DNA gyrase/topoisomerase IV subunit A
MYGHMNDWARYAEKQGVQAKALLTASFHIEETLKIIRMSRDIKDCIKKLMDVLGLDEIGASYVADQRLSVLAGIVVEYHKEYVEELENRLSNIRELAKYEK